jgi:putative heme-binding domain-containing protein
LSGILARKLMRRIYDSQYVSKINRAVEFLGEIVGTDDALTIAVLDGLIEGQSASSLKPTVKADTTLAKLAAGTSKGAADRAQRLGTLWGDTSSVQGSLDRVNDGNASVDDRLAAIRAVRSLKMDAARNTMLKLISQTNSPQPLVLEAVRALGEIGGDNVGYELVQRWKSFTPEAREAAVQVLASRKRWALTLLTAIESKSIAVNELPASVVRTLTQSKDDGLRLRAVNDIGNVRPPNADKVKIIAAKKKMILASEADAKAGHEIAKKTCLVCHKFYGEGAEVGPDLTGAGRSTLDALLANVIDPNQVIGKGYENVEVETKDGRTLSGRMVENTDSHVKLLSIGPKEDVIPKPEIASLRVSAVSVMPEGLEQMPDADFRNLIVFILNGPEGKK